MRRLKRSTGALFAATVLVWPGGAAAHAFGARYDLPLPLDLYLGAAGAAVVASFVIMALFGAGRPVDRRLDIPIGPGPRIARAGRLGLRPLSVALFGLILATGFFGTASPTRNFAPTMVWVIWWVGLAFVSALVGDLWRLANPWSALYDWAGGDRRTARPYPARLGHWPAVALFWAFAWLELISGVGEDPYALAWLITAYSALTWLGMARFGRDAWLAHGEAFTVAFGLIARFAPLAARDDGGPGLKLRPYATGLLTVRPAPVSLAVFVLLMLATVSFDGFVETPGWQAVLDWLVDDATWLHPPLIWLQARGVDLTQAVKTGALALAPILFFAAFATVAGLMAALGMAGGGARQPLKTMLGLFVFALVPIAIAYHLAHYYSYLVLAGQLIIPLASDPFGVGWDLFGTRAYALDISVVDARTVWYLAVGAVVTGHVLAVWLGHVAALRLYGAARAALMSQVPMLALMVFYTMTSLWILSQPIVAL